MIGIKVRNKFDDYKTDYVVHTFFKKKKFRQYTTTPTKPSSDVVYSEEWNSNR